MYRFFCTDAGKLIALIVFLVAASCGPEQTSKEPVKEEDPSDFSPTSYATALERYKPLGIVRGDQNKDAVGFGKAEPVSDFLDAISYACLLYTSPSPRDS